MTSRTRGLASLAIGAVTTVAVTSTAAWALTSDADQPPAYSPAAAPKPPAVVEAVMLAATTGLGDDADQAAAKAASRPRVTAKGGHEWTASELADHGLPAVAQAAYKHAAAAIAPTCTIPWTLIAGIGRVESDHGRYGGSVLGTDGVSRPAIRGIPLNGQGPVAAIRDTDGGALDGDKVWDRAVGPMQFIPGTWESVGRDGDGDGKADPDDINDAALTTAAYLCRTSSNLTDPSAAARAIFTYNADDYYVALVQAFEVGYRTGVFDIPPPPVDEEKKKDKKKKHKKHDKAEKKHQARPHGAKGDAPGSPAAPKPGTSSGGTTSGSTGSSGSGSSGGTKPGTTTGGTKPGTGGSTGGTGSTGGSTSTPTPTTPPPTSEPPAPSDPPADTTVTP